MSDHLDHHPLRASIINALGDHFDEMPIDKLTSISDTIFNDTMAGLSINIQIWMALMELYTPAEAVAYLLAENDLLDGEIASVLMQRGEGQRVLDCLHGVLEGVYI